MTRLVPLGGVSSPHAEEIALAICAEILAVLTTRFRTPPGNA